MRSPPRELQAEPEERSRLGLESDMVGVSLCTVGVSAPGAAQVCRGTLAAKMAYGISSSSSSPVSSAISTAAATVAPPWSLPLLYNMMEILSPVKGVT